jgi:prolyl-tRNA synthetase
MRLFLKPATANAPAKVKDEGVISLVKAGDAAYNAKSGEFLLLPGGALSLRQIKERLSARLFEEAGLQPVNCGSDEAIFSLAERYARDWGDSALSYLDERGRDIRLLGWSEDIAAAEQKTAEIMKAASAELEQICAGTPFSFVEETIPNVRSFSLLFPCEPGSIGARPGFLCRSCGKALLADSPFEFRSPQPGENEPEEELKEVATPGANTIAELCSQLNLDVKRTLKAMLYVAESEKADGLSPVASFIRGDYNISMNKLSCWLQNEYGLLGLRSAEKQELQNFFGEVAGYCGPVGMPENVVLVCDSSVLGARNAVAGANRPGYHCTGCCYGRDFAGKIADIAQPGEGSPCACGGSLEATALREAGVIQFGRDCKNDAPANEKVDKKLSYRDREGSHEYPVIWRGALSAERILLEIGRLR